ncbi:MAG: UDP-2,3-diacylglucosamine diphosphatase [Ignavibacteriae bacterium HGW-Ignavibacteriae-4]|jgi:UDP-2,3-diacylglucosamine hydrolase|nr:MAG: UDP-2,3-diacylglucosamine diphosphatase [Ignavibacteriae bacterium HGW-Ignavibacteriae-4]
MIYFISDLHLGVLERTEDRKREDLFLTLMDRIKPTCEKLYLVGDIFDYWFDYKTVIPKNFYRTLAKLREFTDAGIKIEYLMGNHDFGHRSFFEEELGIEVISTDIEREHNGKKFYISHGDGKADNDTGYLILRSVLRNKISNFIYRIIHPDIGIGLASGSSKKSRSYTDTKDYGENEGMVNFAKKKIDEGFDYVIMGHRHKRLELKHGNGTYYNLGEWIHEPSYGVFDGNEFRLEKV